MAQSSGALSLIKFGFKNLCPLCYYIVNTAKKVKGLVDSYNDFYPYCSFLTDNGDNCFSLSLKLKNYNF